MLSHNGEEERHAQLLQALFYGGGYALCVQAQVVQQQVGFALRDELVRNAHR